jgi:hypothetical protein
MRRALLACLLAGCYHASNLACAVSCENGQSCPNGLQCGLSDHLCHGGGRECSEIDAGVPDDAGEPPLIDAPNPDAPSVPFCDRSQATIIACYQFEGNTDNESMYTLTTTRSAVAFPLGKPELGRALQLTMDSSVLIGDTVSLDLQQFTVEAWLDQSSSTNMNNVFAVDNADQYGMFVDVNNDPYCAYVTAPPPPAQPTLVIARAPLAKALTPGQWTHVACVYNGTSLTLYMNGTMAMENPTGGAVATASVLGTGIGSVAPSTPQDNHYVGLIDNLRIWSVARTRTEICADAAPNCH